MAIDFGKIEKDTIEYLKTNETRQETVTNGMSKAIIFAIEKYHEELMKQIKKQEK